MKTTFLLLVALTTVTVANAQIPGRRAMSAAANQSTLGKLIAQLTENINPSALKPAFAQNERNFIQRANTTVQIATLAALVKSLQAGLKPTAFGPNWAYVSGQWLSDVNNIQTVQDAANLVNTLSDNLDPSAYAAQWEPQEKPSFKGSINSVTQ